MPLTNFDVISSAQYSAGANALATRRITVAPGARGLFVVVQRNTNVQSTWFRPGTVTWQAVLPGGAVIGLSTVELLFDVAESFLPPEFLWGGDFRATVILRNFIPLVTVSYGRLLDS